MSALKVAPAPTPLTERNVSIASPSLYFIVFNSLFTRCGRSETSPLRLLLLEPPLLKFTVTAERTVANRVSKRIVIERIEKPSVLTVSTVSTVSTQDRCEEL